MSSKNYKQAVTTANKNFQKYIEAMEWDIQNLISTILDVIETKIISLRKLLKLKMCIKHVKSLAALDFISRLEEFSMCQEDVNKKTDSLDDLMSSMVYEVDKNSLPVEESIGDHTMKEKMRLLEACSDLESLCTALNPPVKNVNSQENNHALDKYIYMLLDAKKQTQNQKQNKEKKKHTIGDFLSDLSNRDQDQLKASASKDSYVYLGKAEYESILNILNMVLKSYKMQEVVTKSSKAIEKVKTEPAIASKVSESEQRKIVSDSICQQKAVAEDNKLSKNKKNSCLL